MALQMSVLRHDCAVTYYAESQGLDHILALHVIKFAKQRESLMGRVVAIRLGPVLAVNLPQTDCKIRPYLLRYSPIQSRR
jgi:hypothetical protein